MFEYLAKHKYTRGGDDFLHNVFFEVTEAEITAGEKILGRTFPEKLKVFWREVGYGNLCAPHDYDYKTWDSVNVNEILPPIAIANFMKGKLIWEDQKHWMSEGAYSSLEADEFPFFEIRDSCRFLSIKSSVEKDSIWIDSDLKIEDSFERFIWRLYYDSPSFYENIIDEDLEHRKKEGKI